MADFKDKANLDKLIKVSKDLARKKVAASEVTRVAKEVGTQFITEGGKKGASNTASRVAKEAASKASKALVPSTSRAVVDTAVKTSKALVPSTSRAVAKTAAKTVGKSLAKKAGTAAIRLASKAAVPLAIAVEALSTDDLGPNKNTISAKLEAGEELSPEEESLLKAGIDRVQRNDAIVDPMSAKIEEEVPTKSIAIPGRTVQKDFEISESEAERQEIERSKQTDLVDESRAIKEQQSNDQQISQIDDHIEKLKADIEYANSKGLSSVAMQSEIKKLQVEKEALIGTPSEVTEEGYKPFPVEYLQDGEVVDPAMEVSKDDVIDQAKEINKQRTTVQAQQLALQNEIDEQRSMVNKAMENMRNEDSKLMSIDTNRFWNSRNTWQKIGLGISMLFGGAGGVNRAAQTVQNFIDKDIDAQKTDNKNKLAKREEAFRRVNAELNRMEKLTSSQAKIENIKLLKQKLAAEQVKANEERKKLQQASLLKDLILKKGIKVEDLSPSQINAVFNKEDFKKAQNLRNEYNKQTTKLGTREVVNAFGDISALANKDDATGPTDIFLLTKAMKFIDPNSVVREGEFHIAETASPPIKALVRIAQKMAKGTRLLPSDRKNFLDNARMLLKVKLKTQESINKRYKSLSRQHGLPSSMIVENFSLSTVSPREALFEKQKAKNPKLKRDAFENSIDNLINAGRLSTKFKD